MFDHVAIRAADIDASARFYRTVLDAIELAPDSAGEQLVRWREFILVAANAERPATRHVHIAFAAPSREHVEAFWRAGREAGYDDDGEPGERTLYRDDYYGAFLRDPGGNSAEAVHHGDTRRGGCIDHIWIRVADVAATAAFYTTIARHTGLREGRRNHDLVQFRGAWATFTLVADELPLTENLHLAFAAPDRRTVDDFHAAALAAGYTSNGEPGERPRYGPDYYGAFALAPDGTNVESVTHASA